MYLAYEDENNDNKRFGYFYTPLASLCFSIRFMATEAFSVIKKDQRFLESIHDVCQMDKFKNFLTPRTLKKKEKRNEKQEPRVAKIFCNKHFEAQFPRHYKRAISKLEKMGAEFKVRAVSE